jgi:hypothetical protein
MFAASAQQPRIHLTAAAKAIALAAIKHGHLPHSPAAAAGPRPLRNRFGRSFLPVEADIPLPETERKVTARPFAHMQIGESFFEPAGTVEVDTLLRRMKSDAKEYSPMKFLCEAREEEGVPGARAWRVV